MRSGVGGGGGGPNVIPNSRTLCKNVSVENIPYKVFYVTLTLKRISSGGVSK